MLTLLVILLASIFTSPSLSSELYSDKSEEGGNSSGSIVCKGQIAALVLLTLFFNCNERCHTTDTPVRMSETLFSNVNNIQFMFTEDQNNMTHNDVVRGTFLQPPHKH